MHHLKNRISLTCLFLALLSLGLPTGWAASSVLVGWNNLGMHCMDSSYAEFSILPPYNTIEAQLIVGGKLVTNGQGYTLTYEAVADPDGSINTTSLGKGNWGDFEAIVYGVPGSFTADMGLAGWNMPGPSNLPQPMLFENFNQPAPGVTTPVNWFRAEGIPLTPYDDAGNKNPYPLMRLVARDAAKKAIATNDIVLPVSDEMDCRACHGANTQAAARPAGGWITDSDPIREYRLNILKVHDEREFTLHPALYADALAAKGLDPAGLHASATAGRPMLCAACHASEALGAPSFSSANGTVPPLTASVHTKHAGVTDPVLNLTLDNSANRAACYLCHPGSATRCLRGAMGNAIAADGSMAMQCQSCHGSMAQVGASSRVGWFMEPKCQSCHSGTATANSGQIRYTSVFDASGNERVPADATFATNPNTPAPGISLYRFSAGHGGLQCSACHGSTHAEFPSAHRNDNLRNIQLQGHAGTLAECTACHTTMPATITGGPHGMHPTGQGWVDSHHDAVSQVGSAACQACHGVDFQGTVLSRVQGNRSFKAGDLGGVSFYRGATVGCYTCHKGPSSSSMNNNPPPASANVAGQTMAGVPVDLVLPGNAPGVTLRIVSQSENGSVGLSNGIATYFPYEGFTGTDTFTFSAYDGAKNSVLATGTVAVVTSDPNQQAPVITLHPLSQTAIQGAAVTLTVAASGGEPLTYQWYKGSWPIPGANSAWLALNPVATTDADTYVVLVRNAASAAASLPAQLTVLVPPTILTGPVSQTVIAGTSVTFNVSATGTAPLTYQWSKNATPIANATSSSLRFANVTLATAGIYQVRVSSAAGYADSALATLIVLAPPAITRQPVSQTVYLGANVSFSVTATGTAPLAFQWYKNLVLLPGANAAALLIAAAADTDAGGYSVVIINSLGSATSATATLTVKPPPPGITGFTPASGPVGTTVTLTGTNFTGATAVKFNGGNATFTVVSSMQITTLVPVAATTGRIAVTTAGGTATTVSSFSVLPAPTIARFSPTSGGVGTAVTITGANLTGATAVKFNGTSATFTVISATTIVCGVPTGATTGKISVTTPGGSATSSTNFSVGSNAVVPTIGSLSPGRGPVGTVVTVTGTNLGGATSVRLGSTSIPGFTVSSAGSLRFVVPAGVVTGKVSLTTAGGTVASSGSFIPTP